MSPPNVLVYLSSGQHLLLQWRCKKSLQKTLQNNLMIGKISFCTCGTDSLSVMSGGLYPCFGSVGNQRTSAEKPSGDKVSQGVFILSALLLKYQLILSWNRSIHKVWGMYIAIMRLKSQKTFLKKKKKSFEQEFKHIFDPTSRSPLLWAIGSAISLYSTVFSNVKFHRPFNKS